MAEEKDYYSLLGVSRTASAEEIRKRFKQLARTTHPDLHEGDAKAAARFKEINEAYGVLGDADKRKIYDEFGTMGLREGFDPNQARAWGAFGGGGPGMGGPGMGFDDMLSNLFRGASGRRRRSRPPQPQQLDLKHGVEVGQVAALTGCKLSLRLERGHGLETIEVSIPAGVRDGQRLRLRGMGRRSQHAAGDLLLTVHVKPHKWLSYSGGDVVLDVPVTVSEAVCGAKIDVALWDGRHVSVTVPANSQTGTTLRLRGLGVVDAAGKAGDLRVKLRVVVPEGAGEALAAQARALDRFYTSDVRAALDFGST